MWSLMFFLVITPQMSGFAPPLTETFKAERIVYMNKELKERVYRDGIKEYLEYVGTKNKFSNSMSKIFNDETIRLMIDNSKTYPSVVVAMSILETGWGKYAIGNNYFGIKGKGHIVTTHEWNGKKFIKVKASFQYYSSLAKGIRAHSKLLHSVRYNIGESISYEDAIEKIESGGYATDPNYAKKLNYIIRKYELTQLDELKVLYDSYVI